MRWHHHRLLRGEARPPRAIFRFRFCRSCFRRLVPLPAEESTLFQVARDIALSAAPARTSIRQHSWLECGSGLGAATVGTLRFLPHWHKRRFCLLGLMFWFTRKKLSGSYLLLIATSRS